MSIHNLLPLLSGVRNTGPGRWMALCPVHQEKRPSFAITEQDGKVLVHCFGCGCGIDEVCQALGINIDEFFPENLTVTYSTTKPKRKHFNAADLLQMLSHETAVVYLCAGDMLHGLELSECDLERLESAHEKIGRIMNHAFY
jgi:Fe-S-cluster-containing hydrogenase component 2